MPDANFDSTLFISFGGREKVEGTGSKIRVSPRVDIPNCEWDRNNSDRNFDFWQTNSIAADRIF